MKTHAKGVLALVATLALTGGAFAADGFFTKEQAQRGEQNFQANCASCHGTKLEGGVGPSLIGPDFLGTWGTADDLYGYFSVAMPPQAPGKLGDAVYTDILAYILDSNGIPEGSAELKADPASRRAINLAQAAASAPAAPSSGASAPAAGGTSSAAATDNASAEPAEQLPQAFTYGKMLPTMQPDGSVKDAPAQPANAKANP